VELNSRRPRRTRRRVQGINLAVRRNLMIPQTRRQLLLNYFAILKKEPSAPRLPLSSRPRLVIFGLSRIFSFDPFDRLTFRTRRIRRRSEVPGRFLFRSPGDLSGEIATRMNPMKGKRRNNLSASVSTSIYRRGNFPGNHGHSTVRDEQVPLNAGSLLPRTWKRN